MQPDLTQSYPSANSGRQRSERYSGGRRCSEVVVGGLQVVGDDCRWSSGVVGCCRCSRVVVDANGYQLEKRMRIREKREGKM